MDPQIATIMNYFNMINSIPRCSGNEGQIRQWLKAWALKRNFAIREDQTGNLVVTVPASDGYENSPMVIIQSHMDMVCEKTPDSLHDFNKDPIISKIHGDWLMADRTTLGADNGIAIAYALALGENDSIHHPQLELLFTVDEERGLNGVKAMQPGLITGKSLINLDSEDEGVFTIGCAGGVETTLTMDLETTSVPANWISTRITIGGLRGGHSGLDIHKQRANANKLLARVVMETQRWAGTRLVGWQGGSRHNAIARDAEAVVVLPASGFQAAESVIAQVRQTFGMEYDGVEPGCSVCIDMVDDKPGLSLTAADSLRLSQLLLALPHGAARFSPVLGQAVETSCNLATVKLESDRLRIVSSQRSTRMSRLEEMTATVHAVAQLAGARTMNSNTYPAWEPDTGAELLAQAKSVYRRLFEKDPTIQVIHAGLECAIIGKQYPGIQLISFGPDIENAHSPDERLHIPSIGRVWDLLVGLLAEMKA